MIWTILTGLNLFGNFIHKSTSQMELPVCNSPFVIISLNQNFTDLGWSSWQDLWRFHLVQQKSAHSNTWWSLWADILPPRWCGSKETAHTCDLVRHSVFLQMRFDGGLCLSEGAWSFDTYYFRSWFCFLGGNTTTSRVARNSDYVNDDLPDLVI